MKIIENLDEMDKFRERHNFKQLMQDTENTGRPFSIKVIKLVNNKTKQNKTFLPRKFEVHMT